MPRRYPSFCRCEISFFIALFVGRNAKKIDFTEQN